jgi:hypothetical protein
LHEKHKKKILLKISSILVVLSKCWFNFEENN